MVVAAWIVAVWLLSLVVFVALRAQKTRSSRPPVNPPAPPSAQLPSQRQPQDSPSQVTDRA